MADTQEQLLTEVTSIGVGDFVRTVDNPTTTPVSAVIKKENFVDGLFGDILSPAAITGSVNNYNPTGLSTVHMVRLTSTNAATITGMGATAAGRMIVVHNIGTFTITLTNEDANSTAGFRFSLGLPVLVIAPNMMVILHYDILSSRWRVLRGIGGAGREVLTATRTYYVRTDGNDSNTGLVNTSAGAFLTIQAAVNAVVAIDNGGFAVTIQIGDGTYTNGVAVPSWVGSGTLTIQGNAATPGNVIVNVTGNAFSITGTLPSVLTIKDLRVQATNDGINFSGFGNLSVGNIVFGACTNFHLTGVGVGANITIVSPCNTVGNATAHYVANSGATITEQSKAHTSSGTLTFSFFAYSTRLSTIVSQSCTFGGATVTAQRYQVDTNAVIYTGGGGATYFPGGTAGVIATGGQYS